MGRHIAYFDNDDLMQYKRYIEAHGWDCKELSRRSGIPYHKITAAFRGEDLSTADAKRLMDAANLPLDEIDFYLFGNY